jgi:hypothetical protein
MSKSLDDLLADANRHRGSLSSFLGLQDRIDRPMAFLIVQRRMNDREYWQNLAEVWTDTEFPTKNRKYWLQFFTCSRGEREHLMAQGEREAFAKLSDPVIIYRGITVSSPGVRLLKNARGMAWTDSLSVAAFFAHRWGQSGTILEAKVSKSKILAYFLMRGENEVVIDPRRIRFQTHPIPEKESRRRAAEVEQKNQARWNLLRPKTG